MTEPNAPATLPLEDREKQAKISIIGKAVPVQIEEVDDTPETDWESDSPLWMSKLPDDPESNDALMGLQVLKFEEEIPEYRAEDYKERGNSLFRQGEKMYRQAVEYYTLAIREKVDDNAKRSTYYTNRAAVHLALKNFGKALDDCKEALALNPKNTKGHFRAGRAAAALEKFNDALQFIEDGLKEEPKSLELLREKKEIEKKRDEVKKKQDELRRRKEEREQEKNKMLTYKKEFYERVASTGVSVGKFLLPRMEDYLKGTRGGYMDDKGEMHWPVMLVYEEHRQTEFIGDMAESSTFGPILEEMFPKGNYQPWDSDHKYVHSKLEIYFIANQTYPIVSGKGRKVTEEDQKRQRKIKLKHSTELRKVLTHPEYVVPGYPVFYIVVEGTSFKEVFLTKSFEGGM